MGVEQSQYTPGNAHREGESGTESGTPDAHSTLIDPNLQRLISAWPTLNESTKAGIVAMVWAAGG